MVASGNVYRVTAENVDQSGLDLSLKTPIFHSHNGCTSSTCGPLVNPKKTLSANRINSSNHQDSTGQNPQHLLHEDFKR